MMKWIIYYLPDNALLSLSLCCGNELLSSHSVDNQEHEEGDDDECKTEGENLGGDVYDEGGDDGVNDDGDGDGGYDDDGDGSCKFVSSSSCLLFPFFPCYELVIEVKGMVEVSGWTMVMIED